MEEEALRPYNGSPMSMSLKYPRVVLKVLPYLLRVYPRLMRYSNHPERYPLEKRYALVHEICLKLTKAFRVDLCLLGKEYFEEALRSEKPLLLVANHLSDYDPIILYALFEKPLCFVAKEEAAKMIGVGRIVKASDGLFLPRKDLRASFFVMKRLEEGLKDPKRGYCIFPEGTRNKDFGETLLLPFHPGSFKPAMKAEALILPVSLYGTSRVLHPKPNTKRIPLELRFGKPMEASEYASLDTEEVASRFESEIKEGLTEILALDKAYYAKGYEKVPLRKGDLWKSLLPELK